MKTLKTNRKRVTRKKHRILRKRNTRHAKKHSRGRKFTTRRQYSLRRNPRLATLPSALTQQYSSSHVLSIRSNRSSPSSNLTTSIMPPSQPIEPSENMNISPHSNMSSLTFDDISPNTSSNHTDTSFTPVTTIHNQL
jgi:hypothetical protein